MHLFRLTVFSRLACGLLFLTGGLLLAAERPLGLDEAIRLALEKNYSVRIKGYGTSIAKAATVEALGKFDLRLQGSYTNAREELPSLPDPVRFTRAVPSITDTDTYKLGIVGQLPTGASYDLGTQAVDERENGSFFGDNYTTYMGISITQPLLKGAGLGAGLYEIRIARTNKSISEWEYRQAVIDTVTDVINTYSELLFAQAQLRSSRRTHELAIQLKDENERRYAVGERSEYEIVSAKARVATRLESILQAEQYVMSMENALKKLISDKRDPSLLQEHLVLAPFPDQPRPALSPAKDFREALDNRPDYRMALLGIRQSELVRKQTLNQALPSVNLVGSYGYYGVANNYADSRSEARNRDFGTFSTGVVVSVPLTGLSERGRYRAAKLKELRSRASADQLEQSILIAVGNAAQSVETAEKRIAATRSARELNEHTLQAEIKRLRAGTGSTFNVLYQQEQLNYAEIKEAKAVAEYRQSVAEYDRQLARTLSIHGISLP